MKKTYSYGRSSFKTIEEGNELSWMIGNGIGGYSNCTVSGGSAMMHHGYLIAALNPPVNRYLIFTRTQEEVSINGRTYDLTSQQYINASKNGQEHLDRFNFDTIPEYIYRVEDVIIKKSISMEYGYNTTAVCYEIENGTEDLTFKMIPLFNYRLSGDSIEKSNLKFIKEVEGNKLILTPEENKDVKITFYASEGEYYDRSLIPTTMATPNYLFEENQYYMIDNRTGFLGIDNHYTPYEINIKIKAKETKRFYVICTLEEEINKTGFEIEEEYKKRAEDLIKKAGYKDDFASNLVKASDHFIVNRNSTGLKTILAGYPWFTDWGRDTMIAFEGLVLCTKRFKDAREILESFSKYVRNGLVPNLFPDANTEPLYNTVDASLWYFQAVYKYLKYTDTDEDYKFIEEKIYDKLVEIFKAYSTKTDFSIRMDEDGLIFAGSGVDQVTWMDVRVGDFVVTPRHGKPVEINALWYNALCIMEELRSKFNKEDLNYRKLSLKVKNSFNKKFWNEDKKCLFDVVDENDDKIRPNQLWAVSLPFSILDREKEKSIVEVAYKHLYSTYGLRSLSFMDEEFKNKYIGKLFKRDLAYHMGTTWGFLIGPFITAYCKVNDYNEKAIKKAKEMISVFEDHMKDGCINGIAEIFDGEFSSTSRGCYSQAWSVGEVLRIYCDITKE
ncbi:glycogen debranching enzyme N-terminal domain-containing protein [Clostridium tertium]|uniref:Amylo-alpha-1,6-glucosidase n=1 Tax=Clostridium tertium TaxID=1559 RepID=A0A9X3XGN8_9CLOT|nr:MULTISPECIES: amylo-alpha-1,6-glucosidase [Clostridium]EEH98105.1 putative glycogen debranching enzyme, archaeal type [Clostridium sp. 7_2_43FAA]MDB1947034.1 glycogen debranching enzyme N-terminal domain-containing protein [Clostridium tertium]MDB1953843.1 glycogen debranching enzyme N-terminal domain-containing protein [Clostridium tertium]MDB1959263.1 glycogen debranching enzyme N-terminal domain-containing protein [Clostridium tertium]MDB1963268.1 glycogen debranching enzyme N-terminal d